MVSVIPSQAWQGTASNTMWRSAFHLNRLSTAGVPYLIFPIVNWNTRNHDQFCNLRSGTFSARQRGLKGINISASSSKLTITQPDDWHLHLRDGAGLRSVVPHTAQHFGRAVIMPNLVPPVTASKQV